METKEKKKQQTSRPVTVHITNHNKFERGVGAFITNLEHLTVVMDAEGNMKLEGAEAAKPAASEKHVTKTVEAAAEKEELFHFVHPEVEEDEAWRIHRAVKRVVAYQSLQDICQYLKEQQKKEKVMLPSMANVMYQELVRLGMPTGKGYSEKYFSDSYLK